MPGSDMIPASPNTMVNLKLRADEILDDDTGSYYFSMKSVDNMNFHSGLSNIASLSYNGSVRLSVNTFTLVILTLAYILVGIQN